MPRIALFAFVVLLALAGCTAPNQPAATVTQAPSGATSATSAPAPTSSPAIVAQASAVPTGTAALPAATTSSVAATQPAAGAATTTSPTTALAPTVATMPSGQAAAGSTTGTAPARAAEATPGSPATATPAARPANTATPVAGGSAAPTAQQPGAPVPATVGLQLIAEGLTSPVALIPAPDNSGRLFVLDQIGVIRIISGDGKLLPDPFLDLRSRMVRVTANYDERGLLGLAFHPDFNANKRLFVYYSAPLRQGGPAGFDNTAQIGEFRVAADNPDRADAGSERVVLQVDHPQANHNGGTLAFGPDGFLYLAIGDGGGANDTGNGHTPGTGNGQDTGKLLGKILRIDVNGGEKYGIPQDNPFAGGGGAPEVYAYGLRNAYRFSFDKGGNHELFAGDVGQNLYEEVNIITRGGNYGWNIREGLHCFSAGNPSQPPADCPKTGARGEPPLDPILEYAHPDPGIAIVGGYIYRGQALPGLLGHYVFGDWSTSFGAPQGVLMVASRPAGGQAQWSFQKLTVSKDGGAPGSLGHFLLGFGQDNAGELYVLTTDRPGPAGNSGRVYKLTSAQ